MSEFFIFYHNVTKIQSMIIALKLSFNSRFCHYSILFSAISVNRQITTEL